MTIIKAIKDAVKTKETVKVERQEKVVCENCQDSGYSCNLCGAER